MKIHDISLPIFPDMLTWPQNQRPKQEWDWAFERGDSTAVSHWTLGAHTGTHLDAPCHVFPEKGDVESIDLTRLVGPTRVVDFSDRDSHIGRLEVESSHVDGIERVLFKTSNSLERIGNTEFDFTYNAIKPDGAEALLERGVTTIGIDYLSVEASAGGRDADIPTHKLLCGADAILLEGLDLRGVHAGDYFMCYLPLRLTGSEASPARAVLIEGIFPTEELLWSCEEGNCGEIG